METKKKLKNKKFKVLQPRISYHTTKTGKQMTLYRCQTCPSFVNKRQPRCQICLGIPHVGKKRANSIRKRSKLKNNEKIATKQTESSNTKEQPVRNKIVSKQLVKSVCTSVVLGKSIDNKEPSSVACVYCFKKTKSKDGICLACKKENQSAGVVKSTINSKGNNNDRPFPEPPREELSNESKLSEINTNLSSTIQDTHNNASESSIFSTNDLDSPNRRQDSHGYFTSINDVDRIFTRIETED